MLGLQATTGSSKRASSPLKRSEARLKENELQQLRNDWLREKTRAVRSSLLTLAWALPLVIVSLLATVYLYHASPTLLNTAGLPVAILGLGGGGAGVLIGFCTLISGVPHCAEEARLAQRKLEAFRRANAL
jgi:hypothetical protein